MMQAQSRWTDLAGASVHWVDHGGPERPDSLIVCVHGLGGGTVNWDGLAPLLTDRHRLVAVDLPGSGLTDPGERNADLDANAELLGAFVDEVAAGSPGARVVLVGNSMGAVLSAMVLGARPDLADALVLLAPAVPGPGRVPGVMLLGGLGLYGVPVAGRVVAWGRRRLRTPEQLVGDTLRMCCADPSRVDPELVARHVELARLRMERTELDRPFEQAARSLMVHLADARRARATYLGLPAGLPVLVVHGTRDRLVPYAASARLARAMPGWHFVEAPGVGHVPQIETPQWAADRMREWLATVLPRAPRA
jgi:pimeloyl-ACP methyl ester carboxylesterase